MKIKCLNTYLIPSQPNIFGKIKSVNNLLKLWDADNIDVICLQETFRWKIGLLSLPLLWLAKLFPQYSVIMIGITCFEGKYCVSYLLVLLVGMARMVRVWIKNKRTLTTKFNAVTVAIMASMVLVCAGMHTLNLRFDIVDYLDIPVSYKHSYRSTKNSWSSTVDGGLLTLSKLPIDASGETDYPISYPGGENCFISTCISNYTIINTHLAPTIGNLERTTTAYGIFPVKDFSINHPSRAMRTSQLRELSTYLSTKNNVVCCGDFNICKYLDKSEYTDLNGMLAKVKCKQIIPADVNDNGLVESGTYRPLDYSDNKSYFEYLDYAFSDMDCNLNFDATYPDSIDHKPFTIEINN